MLRWILVQSLLVAASNVYAYYHTTTNWHYHGPEGPAAWPEIIPEYCGGKSQSPINIIPNEAVPSSEDNIELHGFRTRDIPDPSTMHLFNNGHTVEVSLTGDFYIEGGPLEASYQTAQFHFHWGSVNNPHGSEHAMDGYRYPAEMHIVHWDRDNYQSLQEAMDHKHGLAVLGVFIKIGDHNPTFQLLVDAMDQVKYKGDTFDFPAAFGIAGLMPEYEDLNDYFYYDGSLTTPACNEVVQWIVYHQPIEISQNQLDALYSVYSSEQQDGVTDVPLHDNFRPTQPLNDRTVYHVGGDLTPDLTAGGLMSKLRKNKIA